MKKLRQFQCESCGEYKERFAEDSKKMIYCECGGVAKRMLCAPRYFGNTLGKSPSRK
jgi:hypothetical protein